jgi:transposase
MGKTVYEKTFKEEVVKYAQNYDGPLVDVARKFGIKENNLYNWMASAREHQEEAFVGSGNLRSKDAEIKKLQKEILDLKEENLILKKVAAIFSKK